MAFLRFADIDNVVAKYFLAIYAAASKRSVANGIFCVLLFSRPVKVIGVDAKARPTCMRRFQIFFW